MSVAISVGSLTSLNEENLIFVNLMFRSVALVIDDSEHRHTRMRAAPIGVRTHCIMLDLICPLEKRPSPQNFSLFNPCP